jgi:hypothetical protein
MAFDIGARGIAVVKARVGCCWYSRLSAEILGKSFRALKLSRSLARTEATDADALKIIDKAGDERRLRSNHHQIDRLPAAKFGNVGMPRGIESDAFGDPAETGITRGGVKLAEQWRRGKRPGKRVLAPARSNEKHPHRRPVVTPSPVTMAVVPDKPVLTAGRRRVSTDA